VKPSGSSNIIIKESALAGIIALIIALLTVSWQSWIAATKTRWNQCGMNKVRDSSLAELGRDPGW